MNELTDSSIFVLNDQTLGVIEELGAHMPGGFFIYEAQEPERLLYVNKPVIDLYGCEDLEDFKKLTGFTFRGLVHPADFDSVSASISEQIRASDEHIDNAVYRIIRKDGEVRWVEDYGHYVKTDQYGGVFTVFVSDITEKKEEIDSSIADRQAALDTLSESFEKAAAERITFSRVAQTLASDYFSIYIVNPDTDYFVEYSSTDEYASLGIEKSGEDFFNLSRQNMARIIDPEDKDRFMAIFTKDNVLSIVKRDGHFTTKYRLMVEGRPTWVSTKATLLEDEDGRHLIIGSNKIDAQMKREEEYRARMEEARDRARNDFLANMSHDIRTPMNAIIGYTNIALGSPEDPALVHECLNKIGSSSHFLLSLINDVLDMSKIESGMMQLNIGECDLAAVLHRIEDITSQQAHKKRLQITYQKSGMKHLYVRGDELRIEQILINIISNAIKYTPEGRTVDLLAEETGPGRPGFNRYRFVIRDTGIGISEEYLPHIFDSFTREQNTTINQIQGTGLGLAITARAVEMMGGTISVKSKVGEGSTFTVELELEEAQPAAGENQEAPDPAQILGGRRILIVEDNDINAEIAQMVLSQSGVVCERAADGQQGAEKMRELAGVKGERFAAVLMDIQMPVMNGYESSRAIRAMEEESGDAYFRMVPIVAMSANAYDEDVRACLDAGMNAHIAKPFQPDALLKLLCELIE